MMMVEEQSEDGSTSTKLTPPSESFLDLPCSMDLQQQPDLEAHYKPLGDSDPSTALAPGGAVPLKSTTAITFFVLSVVSTFFQTVAPPLNASVFGAYLHGAVPTVAQFASLQAIAWTLRVLFAFLSDAIQVGGYRRKLWLLVGWIVCVASVGCIAFSDFGAPFCDPKEYPSCWNPKANTTKTAYDVSAPSRVAWYRAPTFFAMLGVVLVQANLDGVLVEIAQREPISVRGTFQTLTYFISGIGGVLARFFMLFCLSAKRYGGGYDWSAGPNAPFYIAFGLGLVAIVLTISVFRDTHNPIQGLPNWCRQLWTLLQTRALYQLLSFRLLTSVFQSPTGPSVMTWVTNLDLAWANVIPRIPYVPTMIITLKKGMGWNWRKAVFITTLGSIIVTSIATFFVIYDVCRNDYFYIIVIAPASIALGMNTLMPGWAMVEVATPGHEATTAAIYATIKDLVVPITARWRAYMAESFPANLALLNDNHTQNQVGYNWIVCLSIQVAGLAFIVLLPAQRKPLLEMKARGELSVLAAVVVVVAYFALLVFAWQQNLKDY
ncbi:hypothetical protein SDRG_15880 [Saprolegnia diclina VS20]|uniref:Major facilitator superfamily (MFS) profile domain-containing protein n=1 Tax=Saprolegnia diclina (strain VS20) TaxID=1156394 RepID=T0R2N9_SAPDV|nr:hypothetical protein SDRG_15880 [Saprolegnia diclina VS20]EQC26293.1 hypothetical protein SDRG_15880 [Saprolegnia diclina VS20]|eukprot:XP_008620288.1 hypothetical protein SDRG_15880 [Saprolegnia diclina VS20]